MSNHTYLFTVGGVSFYEHEEYGDEHPLVAKIGDEWVNSWFWDKPESEEVQTMLSAKCYEEM